MNDLAYARAMFPTPALWEAYCRGRLDALERVRAEILQDLVEEAGEHNTDSRDAFAHGFDSGIEATLRIVDAAIARASLEQTIATGPRPTDYVNESVSAEMLNQQLGENLRAKGE